MTCYVDPIRHTIPSRPRWPFKAACHLYADTPEQLEGMADALDLPLLWYRLRQDFPHYDLTAAKRRRAILAGCVETDRAHAVNFAKIRRLARHRDQTRDPGN